MSLFMASLNSGSNGNCYLIGAGEEAVLVDIGISRQAVEKRLQILGVDIRSVKAIFISHEHTDHISGLVTFLKKYPIPTYITAATLQSSRLPLDPSLVREFRPMEEVLIGNLAITGFPKLHDAADPHSFVVAHGGVTVGVFTDIGAPCKNVKNYFKGCHAVFLETNYDEDMLANGPYPAYLQGRIRGKSGHLSNLQALKLFSAHRASFLSHIFLSHISAQNNDPDIPIRLFAEAAKGLTIVHAPRHEATALYQIEPGHQPTLISKRKPPARVQLSLF